MAGRQHRRRRYITAGCAVIAAAGFGSSAELSRVAAEPVQEALPVTAPTGSPVTLVAPSVATSPSVSGNGQFVVFSSAPGISNDPAGPDRTSSVWLSDRLTGALTELTLPLAGTRVGNSVNPVISSDGCTVTVTTEIAYDLFRDDDEGSRWDIYRTTLPECGGRLGDWAIVSTVVDAEGQAQARNDVDPTQTAAVSSAGAAIAYVRPFDSVSRSNDDAGDAAAAIDVVDLAVPIDDPGRTVVVPGLPTELPLDSVDQSGQTAPALSADGSTLVFTSDATSNLAVAEWATAAAGAVSAPTQVYAWNRDDADPFTAVKLVSRSVGPASAAGEVIGGDAASGAPTVSADGRIIAFSSSASDLLNADVLRQCAGGCPAQIYVFDRDTDANTIFDEPGLTSLAVVSQPAGEPGRPIQIGDGSSRAPALSADGSSIVFSTKATNLLAVQTPGGGDAADGDLIVADLAHGSRLRRAFDSLTPVAGAHGRPHISANGRLVVADSLVAGQLVQDPALSGRHVVAVAYRPTLSIAALDLGTVMVSVPGEEWFANVVNVGPGSFTPSSVTIDEPDFEITGGSCVTDQAPVKPGTSCSVKVVLTPSAIGPLSATLTVSESGFDAIVLTATVKGSGGEPALDAAPDFADYGAEVVGTLSPFTEVFQISNVSLVPAFVASATMSGSHPDDFLITSSSCGAVLAPGEGCPVEVSFRPTGSGRRTATLTASTAVGQYTSVLLSGEGVYTPELLTSPSVSPGRDLGIGGRGFPAGTEIVLGWSDGTGRITTVTTNDKGEFLLNFSTIRSQRPGLTTLVAQATDGTTASVQVEVERTARRTPRRA